MRPRPGVEFEGQQDVFERRERRDELVGLEDEADLAAADGGELGLGKVVDGHAVKPDFARAGRVEPGQQAEQRAFAAAAGADDGDELARRDGEGDALQNVDAARAVLNPLACVPNFNQEGLPVVVSDQ